MLSEIGLFYHFLQMVESRLLIGERTQMRYFFLRQSKMYSEAVHGFSGGWSRFILERTPQSPPWLLESDDGFVGPGPAEFFARETFQGAGIVLDGFNLPVELARHASLFGNVGIEFEDVFAVAFVLLNERQIPEENGQQPGDEEEKNHHSGEFVPNPKIDVHCKELSTRRARTKRRNCKMWRLPLDEQSDISGMYVDCSQSDATPFRDPT